MARVKSAAAVTLLFIDVPFVNATLVCFYRIPIVFDTKEYIIIIIIFNRLIPIIYSVLFLFYLTVKPVKRKPLILPKK